MSRISNYPRRYLRVFSIPDASSRRSRPHAQPCHADPSCSFRAIVPYHKSSSFVWSGIWSLIGGPPAWEIIICTGNRRSSAGAQGGEMCRARRSRCRRDRRENRCRQVVIGKHYDARRQPRNRLGHRGETRTVSRRLTVSQKFAQRTPPLRCRCRFLATPDRRAGCA
jgi:hypothetical protein